MDIEYLNTFERKLQLELIKLCSNYHMLEGVLLETDDINEHWNVLAPEYVADAVREVVNYPVVSMAWAGYLGMAVAHGWDTHWNIYAKKAYNEYYGSDGFDDMDEHIIRDMIGLALDSPEAKGIEAMLRRCGETAITLIRHENIEPQSPMAFHIFARAVKTMYRIGAALQLKRLGYKFHRVDLPEAQA